MSTGLMSGKQLGYCDRGDTLRDLSFSDSCSDVAAGEAILKVSREIDRIGLYDLYADGGNARRVCVREYRV